MPITEIILVRHGETEWNQRGIYQGQEDSPLTPTGISQAQAMGRRLQSQPIDQFYASDLGRAKNTAAEIAAYTGHSIHTETALRERHFGIFQGQDKTTLNERFPTVFAQYNNGDPDYVIPDGESTSGFATRVVTCLETLADRHLGQRLVVVSHGGVLAAFFRHILEVPLTSPRRFALANTSYNRVTCQESVWQLETLGDISHLDDGEALDDETAR